MNLDTELSSSFNSVIDHLKNTCKQVNASGQALVIIHNGKIVTEHYEGYHSNLENSKSISSDSLFHIASVRKSYIGFCVAWAIHNGHIRSIDDAVLNYLPNLNEDIVKGVTLRHLLTHSHGLRTTTDGHLFNFFPAGEGWDYRKENITMLCEIVHRSTGKTVAQIAREEIFIPLGFQKAGWYAEPIDDMVLTVFDRDNAPSYELRDSLDGDLPNMFSTARELAYWGYLHLSNGEIDGKQVVHPEIIKMVTTLQSPKEPKDELPKNGFLWQVQGVPIMSSEIGLTVPKGSYQILGACNQTLLVIPRYDLVVVRMLNRYDSPPGFNYLKNVKSFGDCVTAAAINLFHKLES